MDISRLFEDNQIYILAISGGVDSMVLLDLVSKQASNAQFVVAHFDHAMRPDSQQDRTLVEEAAKTAGFAFATESAQYGQISGESSARQLRYAFLAEVQSEHSATAIVTAHHQDDLVETMIINLLRGTNRLGLSSLQSHADLLRPLLEYRKAQLIEYAQANQLSWREDSTNRNTEYLRNWVRLHVMSDISNKDFQELVRLNRTIKRTNDAIEATLREVVQTERFNVARYEFVTLDRLVALELLAAQLRQLGVENSEKQLVRLWLFAKTAREGASFDIARSCSCQIENARIIIA